MHRIIEAIPPEMLADEVSRLTPVATTATFDAYTAESGRIPKLLREIGRLREITFRAAGEGTGKSLDVDAHDAEYDHIFVWDRVARRVVGAYRVADLAAVGPDRAYTATLFHYPPALQLTLTDAAELGRSFIQADYQCATAALGLLWKAIGTWVLARPHISRLIGPVSISAEYGESAIALILGHVWAHHKHRDQARPRCRWQPESELSRGRKLEGAGILELGDLDRRVKALAGQGMPVLLRHYLLLGAEVMGYNVDADFGNCVDALVIVDLRGVEEVRLRRFMGPAGVTRFLSPAEAA